ncbi:adhesion G protein-coupled receptor E2 [Exaiptasia diaphana]|uniref:EGF-like domain-containing protein n=1 Tax=Exaiptasia diaphana TaxID=2652724 RepID=A0A913YP40_EXADI|nr:adhesion G protein-coupled receptor E2 [Exaiptasia diaphana]
MLTLPTGRQTNQTVTLETRIASIPWDYVMIIIGMTSHVDLVTHTHTQDIDECSSGVHSCDANAQCTNTVGSYTCICLLGFNGDGRTCSDIDECSSGSHSCNGHAQCTNAVGTYTCQCNPGYHGDGWACTDIDECTTGSHSCDANAQCTNNMGSHTCQCNHGFHGDGWTCAGIDCILKHSYIINELLGQ